MLRNKTINCIYIVNEEPYNISGVFNKVLNQSKYLTSNGIKTTLLTVFLNEQKDLTEIRHYSNYTSISVKSSKKPFISTIINRRRIFFALKLYLKSINYDVIFVRNTFCSDYTFLHFVSCFKNKIILESQSKEPQERFSNGRWKIGLLDLFFAPFVYKHLLGCVCVTQEIEHFQKRRSFFRSLNTITLTNGIDVNKYNIRSVPALHNKIKILVVAYFSSHHGIDRLIMGLSRSVNPTKFEIYMVGNGPEIEKLKSLVVDLNISDLVKFEGKKSTEQLNEYFNNCHIAVGSLGLHRNKLKEASTLKVREYCARGIPFILSHYDCDLKTNEQISNYFMTLPPDDQPIDFSKIESFVSHCFTDDNLTHNVKLNDFANTNMSMNTKMLNLTKYIKELV